jgi:hypothetical protein
LAAATWVPAEPVFFSDVLIIFAGHVPALFFCAPQRVRQRFFPELIS